MSLPLREIACFPVPLPLSSRVLFQQRKSSRVTGRPVLQSAHPTSRLFRGRAGKCGLQFRALFKLARPLMNTGVVILRNYFVFIMPTKTKVMTTVTIEKINLIIEKFCWLANTSQTKRQMTKLESNICNTRQTTG